MSQNTLIEKIKSDAAKAVEEIKTQGKAEIEGIEREAEAEITELKEAHQTGLEKKKAHLKLVAVSKAKQSGNIALQTAKREKIDAIFDAVAKELSGQDSEAYVKFFAKHVSEIVPKGVEVEHVHTPVNRKVETAQILKEAGISGEVKEDDGIKAGLVFKTKDGVYDVTLERLMNEKRADLEMVVANRVEA